MAPGLRRAHGDSQCIGAPSILGGAETGGGSSRGALVSARIRKHASVYTRATTVSAVKKDVFCNEGEKGK